MMTFHNFLLKLEAGEMPPAPPGGAPPGAGGPPPPGGDPLGGMGGGPPMGDPMGGGGGGMPAQPRKGINITTVWDALRTALGHSAERQEKPPHPITPHKDPQPKEKKPKSLMQ